MAFGDFAENEQGVKLPQRWLERRRLAHAYLFAGHGKHWSQIYETQPGGSRPRRDYASVPYFSPSPRRA